MSAAGSNPAPSAGEGEGDHPGAGAGEYRFSAAFVVRLLGLGLIGVGVLLLALVGLVALLSLPPVVVTVGVLIAGAALLAIALLMGRRAVVVRLDETGYRVRLVRGAGVTAARWSEVEDLVATTLAGERCVVLRLRDGRSTRIPVGVLAGRDDALVLDLQGRLRRAADRRTGPRRVGPPRRPPPRPDPGPTDPGPDAGTRVAGPEPGPVP